MMLRATLMLMRRAWRTWLCEEERKKSREIQFSVVVRGKKEKKERKEIGEGYFCYYCDGGRSGGLFVVFFFFLRVCVCGRCVCCEG